MTATTDPGRIYAACLAAYNNGKLHGRWIDAAQDPEDLREEINAMLADSPEPGAEEWAIHDYDGPLGQLSHLLGEFPDLDKLSELALAIEEHGDAYAAYALHEGLDYATAGDFEEAYHGEWDSEEAYAEELAEDMGYVHDMQDNPLRMYIDWHAWARDLFIGDYYSAPAPGGVYVFRRY